MNHTHEVFDTDKHFLIDPVTRSIKNNSGKIKLMQGDHMSECLTFEIPRYIDGHDMTLCNRVEVHYLNIGSEGRGAGVYEINDLRGVEGTEDILSCTWLVSRNATKYVGSLSFVLRFICLEDGVIEYLWSTSIYNKISIASNICNSQEVVEEYTDILEQWYQEIKDLEHGLDGVGIQDIIPAGTDEFGGNIYSVNLTNGTSYYFTAPKGAKGDNTQLVDDEMSETSENPVQNKVIKTYIDNVVGEIASVADSINGEVI